MQLLALDFDGMISDSAPESFAVALETYTRMRPESGLGAAASVLLRPGLGSGLVERLHRHPLYRDFLELMPLGNRAEDFAVALSILEREVEVADQAAYDREWRAQDESFLTAFHSSFYERRAEFAESDPAGWRRLLHPYPAFIDLLRARRGEVVFGSPGHVLSVSYSGVKISPPLISYDSCTPYCFIERRKSPKLVTYPGYVKLAHSFSLFHDLGRVFG